MPLIRKTSAADAQPANGSAAKLRDGAPDERWAAARRLTAPSDVGVLTAALAAEPDARVREAILTSLARIGGPESAAAMIAQVRSDDAGVRTAALDGLRAMPDTADASLPALLADGDADVRLLATELARALPGPQATVLLCGLLDREAEPNVCAAAIDVLAEVGGPEALPALARCGERFAASPFLSFAIRVAAERIGAQSPDRLG